MVDVLPSEALAFLDAISGPESRGLYDIRYGGGRFSDFADHPRTHKKITSGPNKGKTSSAAGRYQITETTWDNVIQPALNLPDFSPQSQDIAAWYLAQQDYKRKGGGDLLGDLRTGDPTVIGKAAKKLAGTWTSLPGGIEQTTSVNRFNTAYANALERRMVSPAVPPPPNRGNALGAIAAALGTPETTASAFSPDVGSLQANPAAEDTAPTVPAQVLRALETTRRAETVPATLAAALQPNVATTPAVETATSPAMETIRAQFADDLGTAPTGRTRAPMPPGSAAPRLSDSLEWKLAELADDYTPTAQRPMVNPAQLNKQDRSRPDGLTTRKVQTIAVGPNDPLAGNVSAPDLQSALNRVAEKRRQAQSTNGVAEQRLEQLSRGRRTVYVPSNGGAVRTATSPGALTVAANEATPVPGNGATETIQAEFAPPDGPNPYGGSPVFGNNPDLERLVAQPELGPPVALPSLVADAPGLTPTVALDPVQKKGRMFGKTPANGNPSVQEALAGIANGSIPDDGLIPSKGTGAVIDALNSPGAKLLGQMNMGQRPIMSALANLFLPKQGFGLNPNIANSLVGTSRSTQPSVRDMVATSPAMPSPDGLSLAMALTMGFVDPRSL
jgi:muramidase (phage lysozyme)